MPDTTSALLGLLLQATGGNNNSWGSNLNTAVIQFLEDAVAGQAVIVSTGGTYTLNAAEARASTLLLSNTLTSDLTIVVPDTAKNYRIVNYNVVNGFFTLLKCATAATKVNVPRSKATEIVVANGTPFRSDRAEVGRYVYDSASVNGDAVECDGTLYKRASLPDLFAKIGTTYGTSDSSDFKVPNAYDTGRFLRSRTAAVTVGTAQTSQNKAHTHTGSGTTGIQSASHTHGVTGAPAVGSLTTDSQGSHTHTATVTDPGHVHTLGLALSGGYQGGGNTGVGNNANTGSSTTGITVANASAGAHTHTVTGTLTAGTLATAIQSADHTHNYSFTTSGGSADGAEARPESLVGILCIKY